MSGMLDAAAFRNKLTTPPQPAAGALQDDLITNNAMYPRAQQLKLTCFLARVVVPLLRHTRISLLKLACDDRL
jgi:hypothetical protein